jgi:hypothetical protein
MSNAEGIILPQAVHEHEMLTAETLQRHYRLSLEDAERLASIYRPAVRKAHARGVSVSDTAALVACSAGLTRHAVVEAE